MWGATGNFSHFSISFLIFQSTLPVWGATSGRRESGRSAAISIHAPRVGSDRRENADSRKTPISIHAPRVGSDEETVFETENSVAFQSTLPVWGATSQSEAFVVPQQVFQSTLPVWGATRTEFSVKALTDAGDFNPRSPCGERPRSRPLRSRSGYFNPRSPCGERLGACFRYGGDEDFNPRSPCGERPTRRACTAFGNHFNPRSPCGERLDNPKIVKSIAQFQSTLPVWGATPAPSKSQNPTAISIHAPRVGSDAPPRGAAPSP